MAVTFSHMQGASEMDKMLQELPKELARGALRSALMAGAGITKKALEQNAPVGPSSKAGEVRHTRAKGGARTYGKLKDNIKRKSVKDGDHSSTVIVGTGDAFWGLFLEYGTRHMSARPWARPAWESSKQAALNMIGIALGKSIEKAAEKLNRQYGKSGLASRGSTISSISRLFGG